MVIASQSSLTWVTWFRPMTQKRGSWEKNPGFPCHMRLSANKLSNEPAPPLEGRTGMLTRESHHSLIC